MVWESCISDGKRNPHLCAELQKVFLRPCGFVSGTKTIWIKTWYWVRYHLSFPLLSSWHNFGLWHLALSGTMPRNSPGKIMCQRPFSIPCVNNAALALLPLALYSPSALSSKLCTLRCSYLREAGRDTFCLILQKYLTEVWQHGLWTENWTHRSQRWMLIRR